MKILYGFLILAFTVACESENEEDLFPSPPPLEEVTFSARIQPLIKTNCAVQGCHVAGAQLPTLETYDNINTSKGRIRVRAIDQMTMPKGGPLKPNEINDLRKWLDEGALNN